MQKKPAIQNLFVSQSVPNYRPPTILVLWCSFRINKYTYGITYKINVCEFVSVNIILCLKTAAILWPPQNVSSWLYNRMSIWTICNKRDDCIDWLRDLISVSAGDYRNWRLASQSERGNEAPVERNLGNLTRLIMPFNRDFRRLNVAREDGFVFDLWWRSFSRGARSRLTPRRWRSPLLDPAQM